MALTDSAVRNAKPEAKPYKKGDAGGLFLLVNPTGGKLWRLKYRMDGKERLLAIGSYPELSLAQAREQAKDARALLAQGVDPSQHKKATKEASKRLNASTFEAVAHEWLGLTKRAPTYGPKLTRRLENHVFPHIGTRPIAEISKADMVALLERIPQAETARRVRWLCAQVFDHAIETDRAERNPTPLAKTLPTPEPKHRAAIIQPDQVAGLLRAIDSYQGTYVTKSALQLAPLVFVRPGELRAAEWSEIDLEAGTWEIPATRMKMKQPHLVPLSTQAVAILQGIKGLTGHGRYVFPSARTSTRPMSDNAILSALRRMGFEKDEMSGHGFRAMARTILDEVLQVRPDLIEHQLAHAVKDANGRAYNRTSHLPERRRMMQLWADYLDGLKTGAAVVAFKKPAKV